MVDDAPSGAPGELFEAMYRNAAGRAAELPWATEAPSPLVARWLAGTGGSPGEAVVVACGLGDDAEALAQRGWTVTAFDISATAIAWCKQRFPASSVNYLVADLFTLPVEWRGGFQLVVEVLTVQSLPPALRLEVIGRISDLVAPGGTLLVSTFGRPGVVQHRGPPWPLVREELDEFGVLGLDEVRFDASPSGFAGFEIFEVVYTRPASSRR